MTDHEIDDINEWLAVPSAAETAIATATKPEQSHGMEGVSAAAMAYAREQHNYEMFVTSAKLYLLARRKTTELLVADNMRVIDGLQFTPMQWSRRLKEYKVPAETLDGYFDNCIANGWNPSIAGMLKEAYPGEGSSARQSKSELLKEISEIIRYYILGDSNVSKRLSHDEKKLIERFLEEAE